VVYAAERMVGRVGLGDLRREEGEETEGGEEEEREAWSRVFASMSG
jgi:hypothetical protein